MTTKALVAKLSCGFVEVERCSIDLLWIAGVRNVRRSFDPLVKS